ncbi:hypothetical protein PTSG_08504 [Salpingoeca rosetta]|uniref:Uncharacterized protein n=1 Tax=Salpingoeca rosetta (strain ATCC 50818 / BSB-021) TaxID=946362 RepID=F2UJV9_SALR5|nr:uncharacterized protein PTSG_08504 [Salpingoeca rosetta]EGD77408.1 hypothetical protein PTSG_08504 [Salpingoeca rosetta]|eukprot:XP_004990752.1 hypothetical protein PTSG_08504 [Salpingoeca rosetta]
MPQVHAFEHLPYLVEEAHERRQREEEKQKARRKRRRRFLVFLCVGMIALCAVIAIPVVLVTEPTASTTGAAKGNNNNPNAAFSPTRTCQEQAQDCVDQHAKDTNITSFITCATADGHHTTLALVEFGLCMAECTGQPCKNSRAPTTTRGTLQCWQDAH